MGSRMVGFRVPEDIYEEIERVSEERGVTTADFLRKLVDETLYPSSRGGTSTMANTSMKEQLGNLEDTLNWLTDEFNNLSNRVDELGDIKELKRVANTMTEADRKELDKLSGKVGHWEQQGRELEAKVGKLGEAVDHNAGVLNRFVEVIGGKVERLEDGVNELKSVQASHTHNGLSSIPQLLNKVGKLEQNLSEVKAELGDAKKRAMRQPTGRTRDYKRDGDTRSYTFKEYASPKGLTKPYRIATDLIHGARYIDLAEPED